MSRPKRSPRDFTALHGPGPYLWSECAGCGRIAKDLRSRIYFPKPCPTPGCESGGLRVLNAEMAAELGADVQQGLGL